MVAAGLWSRSPGEDPGTESETLEAMQVLLDLGADINAVDKNGETAMHAAAYKNMPKVVKFLAAKGAKIDIWNKDDKFGWTPLAIAAGYRFGNFKPSAGHRGRDSRSDDRGRRHAAEGRRRDDQADLLEQSSPSVERENVRRADRNSVRRRSADLSSVRATYSFHV